MLLGPFATQHLADMGADVIKVEPPEGDLLRVSGGSMGRDKSMGPIYMAANRNKRSLCLDLKKPAACAVLKELVKKADLFIHNSRPQAIERLGLGYEDLKKVNPSIIYAYSLGYARKGPYGHKPAFDDLVQGVSGAASLQSRVDGLPPRFMPSLIADKTTGLHLCIAVLGALYHRQKTGEGQMIEVPMLETLASFWLTEHLFGATWTPERGAMGYDRIINKFRHPFKTKDGYICALPYTDAHWLTFFELAGRPDLCKEQRFIDRNERAKHFSELYQILASLLEHMVGYPFVYAVYLSMTHKLVGMAPVFVGMENYVRLYEDGFFRRAVYNSCVFTFGSVGFKLGLGMLMALVLTSRVRFRSFWTGVLLIPWVAPTVVTALNFLWIFDGSLGVLNYLLVRVFHILPQGVGWLSDPGTAMASVIGVNVWRGFPFFEIASWPA